MLVRPELDGSICKLALLTLIDSLLEFEIGSLFTGVLSREFIVALLFVTGILLFSGVFSREFVDELVSSRLGVLLLLDVIVPLSGFLSEFKFGTLLFNSLEALVLFTVGFSPFVSGTLEVEEEPLLLAEPL